MLLTDEVRPSDARTQAMGEAGAAIARQLNGPLTALLLYIGEIKLHSHEFAQAAGPAVEVLMKNEPAINAVAAPSSVRRREDAEASARASRS
jgi:hypothetical protein